MPIDPDRQEVTDIIDVHMIADMKPPVGDADNCEVKFKLDSPQILPPDRPTLRMVINDIQNSLHPLWQSQKCQGT